MTLPIALRHLTPLLAGGSLSAGLLLLAAPASTLAAGLTVQVSDATGKPLDGAVVFLESAEARAAVKPLAGVEIGQQGKRFQPAVSVVTVGSAVSFPNRDTVRHHVYSFSPVKKFEIKLYVGTPTAPVVFDQPGIAVLGCNIHDGMAAWVVIVDTPYHGMTSGGGKLALASLPAGSYRLRSWHPSLPPGAPAQDEAFTMPAAPSQGTALASVRLVGASAL